MTRHFPYRRVYPLVTLQAMKDVGLRIRVQKELREQFLAACQAQDKPAAQVLREFMRAYVREHEPFYRWVPRGCAHPTLSA